MKHKARLNLLPLVIPHGIAVVLLSCDYLAFSSFGSTRLIKNTLIVFMHAALQVIVLLILGLVCSLVAYIVYDVMMKVKSGVDDKLRQKVSHSALCRQNSIDIARTSMSLALAQTSA